MCWLSHLCVLSKAVCSESYLDTEGRACGVGGVHPPVSGPRPLRSCQPSLLAFCPGLISDLHGKPFEALVSQARSCAIAVVIGARGFLSDSSLSMLTCHNYPEEKDDINTIVDCVIELLGDWETASVTDVNAPTQFLLKAHISVGTRYSPLLSLMLADRCSCFQANGCQIPKSWNPSASCQ